MDDLVVLVTIFFENKIQRSDNLLKVSSFCQTLQNMSIMCGTVDLYNKFEESNSKIFLNFE